MHKNIKTSEKNIKENMFLNFYKKHKKTFFTFMVFLVG